jgi:hypothetical protein
MPILITSLFLASKRAGYLPGLDLGVRYVLFLRRIGIKVLAAFGVEPNVHGAIVHDLDLIEVKLRMTHQLVFDDLFEVFLINLDLVFYKAFITHHRQEAYTAL